MFKFIIILVTAFIFYSCNYRIYINGHFDHRDEIANSEYLKSNNDSCIILDSNERIPDSSVFINDIKIMYPQYQFFIDANYTFCYPTIERVKNEAKRIGANIVKISSIGLSRKRYFIATKMYHLNENYLTSYRKRMDSLNLTNKAFCIVHIKCYRYTITNDEDVPIYLDDSLMGYCHHPNKDNSNDAFGSIDFRFDKDGTLSRHPGKKFYFDGIVLEKGKEYFLQIARKPKGGDYLRIATKFDF